MAKFCSLFSGSNGNSTYIGAATGGILIDAGRSCRQLVNAMKLRGIERESIRAVLVTHEHTDHISGLKVLLKNWKVPLYATREVLEKLAWDQVFGAGQEIHPVDAQKSYEIGPLVVEPFDTPHDSIHSVGYKVHTPDGRKLAVATDMGYLPESVRKVLSGCDLVLLESNYEPVMLSACGYPYALKRRIASNLGHLSNPDCAAELVHLVKSGTTRLILGHLSEQSNTPEVAYQSASMALQLGGMQEGKDYILKVASREGPQEVIQL